MNRVRRWGHRLTITFAWVTGRGYTLRVVTDHNSPLIPVKSTVAVLRGCLFTQQIDPVTQKDHSRISKPCQRSLDVHLAQLWDGCGRQATVFNWVHPWMYLFGTMDDPGIFGDEEDPGIVIGRLNHSGQSSATTLIFRNGPNFSHLFDHKRICCHHHHFPRCPAYVTDTPGPIPESSQS